MRSYNLGFEPKAPTLRNLLIDSIPKREPDEKVIVHHVTDHGTHVQYEVERNSKVLGMAFERILA